MLGKNGWDFTHDDGNYNYVNSSEMIMMMVTLSMMMVTVISLTIHDDGNSSYGNYYVIK